MKHFTNKGVAILIYKLKLKREIDAYQFSSLTLSKFNSTRKFNCQHNTIKNQIKTATKMANVRQIINPYKLPRKKECKLYDYKSGIKFYKRSKRKYHCFFPTMRSIFTLIIWTMKLNSYNLFKKNTDFCEMKFSVFIATNCQNKSTNDLQDYKK